MANIFSEIEEKRIPKNFKDCYTNDSLTDSLWQWVKNLEKIGKIFAILFAIITIIISIAMFEDTDGASVVIGIFVAPIIAFLEYVSFHMIALLLASLASIVQNTKISANIELYKHINTINGEDITAKEYACACGNIVSFGQYKCEKCNRKFDWTKL